MSSHIFPEAVNSNSPLTVSFVGALVDVEVVVVVAPFLPHPQQFLFGLLNSELKLQYCLFAAYQTQSLLNPLFQDGVSWHPKSKFENI